MHGKQLGNAVHFAVYRSPAVVACADQVYAAQFDGSIPLVLTLPPGTQTATVTADEVPRGGEAHAQCYIAAIAGISFPIHDDVTPYTERFDAPFASLDKDVIRVEIRRNIARVHACYAQGLTRKPELRGRLAITFTIDRNGQVSQAEAQPGFPDTDVARCVVESAYSWAFPKPEGGGGGLVVTYPFVLAPNDPAAAPAK